MASRATTYLSITDVARFFGFIDWTLKGVVFCGGLKGLCGVWLLSLL